MNLTCFTQLVEQIKPIEVFTVTRELVAIPSHPEAGTREVAGWLREYLSVQGLPCSIQATERESQVNLLAGYGELTDTPYLLLNSHLDTVPPSPGQINPQIQGSLLFGRGAADAKGAVAAVVMALLALHRARIVLERPVMVAAVAGEEIGGLGTKVLLSEIRPSVCIVGEPTQLRLVIAHKGVEWIEITVHGRSAHASCPQAGVNSIVGAAHFVRALEELGACWARTRAHPLLGVPTLNVGMIHGGVAPNVVPDRCVFLVDLRWLPNENIDDIYRDILRALDHVARRIPGIQVEVKRKGETRHCRPLETPPDHPFVKALQRVAIMVGLPPDFSGVPYGTDGGLLSEKGIPTVVWGPGDIAQAHSAGEFIDLEEVWLAFKAYLAAIVSLCGLRGQLT